MHQTKTPVSISMVRGSHADVVNEAVYRYLGWPIYHHNGTAEPSAVSFKRP